MSEQDSEMEVECEEDSGEELQTEQVEQQEDNGSQLPVGTVAETGQRVPAAESSEIIAEILNILWGSTMVPMTEMTKKIEGVTESLKAKFPSEKSVAITEGFKKMMLGAEAAKRQSQMIIQLAVNEAIGLVESEGRPETEEERAERELNSKRIMDMMRTNMMLEGDRMRKIREDQQENKRQRHRYFAKKVFEHMLNYFGIIGQRRKLDPKKSYKSCMGRAVLGISMIYRDEWRKVFKTVKDKMIDHEKFAAYCYVVPVEEGGTYFYSVLQRAAVIFEMALFCFEHNLDYFDTAIIAVHNILDYDFFDTAGSWPRFEKAAEIVSTLTLPLQHVLGCEKRKLKSFSDVIEKLVEKRVIGENSREHSLFRELDKKFEMRSKEARDSGTDASCEVSEDEKQVLLEYFRECFPDDCPQRLPQEDGCDDYIINLDRWIPDALRRKNRPEVAEILAIQERESKRESAGSSSRSRPKGKSKSVATEEPGKDTGAIPKRQDEEKKPQSYCTIQTDHAEEFVELYRQTFPTFLKTYVHHYFIPDFGEKADLFDCENVCFLLPEALMKKRLAKVQGKSGRQDRLWGKSPRGTECILPMALDRKLDSYIESKQYRIHHPGMGGEILYDIGPRSRSSRDRRNRRQWVIKKSFDEVIGPQIDGDKALKRFEKLLEETREYRSSTLEEDFESLRMSRLYVEGMEEIAAAKKDSSPEESSSPQPGPSKAKRRRKKK